MTAPLVVVGDALLDVDLDGASIRDCPDAPGAPVVDVGPGAEHVRPGGAALAALLAARCLAGTRPVVLLTALAADDAAHRIVALLEGQVGLHRIPLDGSTPVKTRVLDGGRPVTRIDTGDGHAASGGLDPATASLVASAGALLVADYGRGVAAHPGVRQLLAARAHGVPLVWDPHPRGAAPLPDADLVVPNAAEAAGFAGPGRIGCPARRLRERWRARAVAITRGADGALLATGRATPTRVPVPAAARPVAGRSVDTCGAGDVFAAAAAAALSGGAPVVDAVAAAVTAASRFVGAGGAAALGTAIAAAGPRPADLAALPGPAAPDPEPSAAAPRCVPAVPDLPCAADGFALADRVRSAGGRVVATGGCFDLLHPGHLAVLHAARARGDILVVCLNGDESVARLKGPGRPCLSAADRAAVLSALACVDAVVVFDEDDPSTVLDRLRPDLWVKGGDHDPGRIPEARVVRAHGGTVETVPRVGEHSTTRLAAVAAGTRSRTRTRRTA